MIVFGWTGLYNGIRTKALEHQRRTLGEEIAMKKSVSTAIMLMLVLSILLTACGGPGGSSTTGNSSVPSPDTSGKDINQAETTVLSPENTSDEEPESESAEIVTVSSEDLTADSKLGVKVELSPLLFDYVEDELDISIQPSGTETAENGDWQATTYEINISDMHDLDTWIDIRLPYEGKFCDPGEDPAECVGAKYLNEETGEWEDVLFDVDAEAGEVVIHTDHLSKYGCFEVKNAGLRKAYISEIDAGVLYDSLYGGYVDESAAALAEYAAKGASSEKCFKLGEVAMTDFFTDVSNSFAKVNDAGTALQLSDVFFFTEKYAKFNEGFWDKMGDVGFAFSAVNLGLEIIKEDKSDADILNIYKDAGMFLLSATEETALGIGLVGVSMIDRSITDFAKAAQGYKVERINNLYLYYNDKFPGGRDYGTDHVARTTKEWRDIVAKAVADSEGDEAKFKKYIENEIDSYARKFFKESDDVVWQLQTDFAEHFSGGRVGNITKDDEEELVKQYKERMYQRLSGAILKEMQKDYQRKVEQTLLDKMNAVKDELNRTITFNIHENMDDKDEPSFGGCQLRFAELSFVANSEKALKNWSGKLKQDGTATTEATVIGYILAGLPDRLDVYDPNANMDKDEPVISAAFSFSYPTTEIVIEDIDVFSGMWYALSDSGERRDGGFKVEKNGTNSYTVSTFGPNGIGVPIPAVISDRNNKELILDLPENKQPIYMTLTDSDHMTMSGISVIAGDKIVDTWTSNLVRGN